MPEIKTSVHLFYGSFATARSLYAAAIAYPKIKIFELVILRIKQSETVLESTPLTKLLSKVPIEVWNSIKVELISIELDIATEWLLTRLTCEHCLAVDGDPPCPGDCYSCLHSWNVRGCMRDPMTWESWIDAECSSCWMLADGFLHSFEFAVETGIMKVRGNC